MPRILISPEKEIKGVDPKTYGGFDEFVDRVQKISKYVFPVLGASLTAGCSAEMIEAITRTEQTPEVSSLPSDLTKTPELSPTEVPIELTPTIQNTATATEMPTVTATPEPTATKEASAIPEGFQIFTEITGLDGKVYDVTTVEGLKALNETNSDIVINSSRYRWLQDDPEAIIFGSYLRINTPGIQIGSGDNGNEVVSINGEVVGVSIDPVNIDKYIFIVDTGVTGLWPVKVSFNQGSAIAYVEINNDTVSLKEKNYLESYYSGEISFLEGISQLDDSKKIITFNEPLGEVDSSSKTLKTMWIVIQD